MDPSGEVGSEARVRRTGIVVSVHREFGALNNAVDRTDVGGQVIGVVHTDWNKTKVGFERHAIEQKAVLVAPDYDGLLSSYLLFEELKALNTCPPVNWLTILDGEKSASEAEGETESLMCLKLHITKQVSAYRRWINTHP